MSKLKNHYNLTKSPILIHLFSNACGFIIYQYVLNESKKANSPYEFILNNQVGLIFDSTPGWPPNEFFRYLIKYLFIVK